MPAATDRVIRAVRGTADDAWQLVQELSRDGMAGRLARGTAMRTKPTAMAELAAALQFPPYAGHSWDALAECLAEPEGQAARTGCALVIADADQLLADGTDRQRRILLACLGDAILARPAGSASPLSVTMVATSDPAHLERMWRTQFAR